MIVKICIGDKVQESLITFTSVKRPLDTVKEEVSKLELLRRGMSLDPYRLVTVKNALVSDFPSIEDQQILIFHIPEKIVPLSGNEWTDVQLDQLKVHFEDVELNKFFHNAGLSSFQLSARGEALAELLRDHDESLHRKYSMSQRVMQAMDALLLELFAPVLYYRIPFVRLCSLREST